MLSDCLGLHLQPYCESLCIFAGSPEPLCLARAKLLCAGLYIATSNLYIDEPNPSDTTSAVAYRTDQLLDVLFIPTNVAVDLSQHGIHVLKLNVHLNMKIAMSILATLFDEDKCLR